MDLLAINAIVGLPAKNRNGKQLKELSAFLKGNNADWLKAARTLKYFTDLRGPLVQVKIILSFRNVCIRLKNSCLFYKELFLSGKATLFHFHVREYLLQDNFCRSHLGEPLTMRFSYCLPRVKWMGQRVAAIQWTYRNARKYPAGSIVEKPTKAHRTARCHKRQVGGQRYIEGTRS